MDTDLKVERIVVGQLSTNCYVVEGGNSCVIIDPGDNSKKILEYARSICGNPVAVISSHGHFDHLLAAREVADALQIPFCIHEKDANTIRDTWGITTNFGIAEDPPTADVLLNGTETWDLGNQELEIIHTPGHTRGSICLRIGKHLFSGDLLFNGSIGRTDFGGNSQDMIRSLELVSKMKPDTLVHPGHGPDTKIADERETITFFVDFLRRS